MFAFFDAHFTGTVVVFYYPHTRRTTTIIVATSAHVAVHMLTFGETYFTGAVVVSHDTS
jgi:hypothetical protein